MSKVAIELENELTFDSTPKRVWELMSDVPSLVPCIPGARLLEAVDDSKWRGEVALDLGFTRVVFIADVVRREMDADAGRTVIEIDAVDSKGRSTAKATMTSLL